MSAGRTPIDLDQEAALAPAVTRLATTFDGVFGAATIERYLRSSFEQLADGARIVTFLPLLAERFTRERLSALAQAEGAQLDATPVVLFLCLRNAGRSQMALAFFRRYAGQSALGFSGGAEPGAALEPEVIAAMAERGIDISDEFPKPWTDEVVEAADVVITMGCGDACPLYSGKRYEEWTLDDPERKRPSEVRAIRDDIERRVLRLLEELRLPAAR